MYTISTSVLQSFQHASRIDQRTHIDLLGNPLACDSFFQRRMLPYGVPLIICSGKAVEAVRRDSSDANRFIEWLASGGAPCQANARAAATAEVKSLRGRNEVLLLCVERHSSPAKRYPYTVEGGTQDISLAQAILQGKHEIM